MQILASPNCYKLKIIAVDTGCVLLGAPYKSRGGNHVRLPLQPGRRRREDPLLLQIKMLQAVPQLAGCSTMYLSCVGQKLHKLGFAPAVHDSGSFYSTMLLV
jgi:hypothetical protein